MIKMLVTLALTAIMLPLAAHPNGHGRHDPFEQLNLTDKQKKEVEAIRAKHKAALDEKHKAVEEAEKGGDAAKIKAAKEARREAFKAFRKECDPILTAEQKAELEKRRAEHKH